MFTRIAVAVGLALLVGCTSTETSAPAAIDGVAAYTAAPMAAQSGPPTLMSMSPTPMWPSTWTITLTGSGFDAQAQAQAYDNQGVFRSCRTMSRAPTRLVVECAMTVAWPFGTHQMRVVNLNLTKSNGVPFDLWPVALRLSSVSPTSVPRGTFQLTLSGTGLDGRAFAQFYKNGMLLKGGTVLSRSPTQLTVETSLSVNGPGTYAVEIHNSTGVRSNPMTFTVR
jgi:hypothetical protein